MTTAPAQPEGLHAEGRGDLDPAVRVCEVDSQREALRRAPKGAPRSPPASLRLPASDRPHHPLVCQGPQDAQMREHRSDHPGTAAILRAGNGTAKRMANTQ